MGVMTSREAWQVIKQAMGLPDIPASKCTIILERGEPVRMHIEGFAPFSVIEGSDWSILNKAIIHFHTLDPAEDQTTLADEYVVHEVSDG